MPHIPRVNEDFQARQARIVDQIQKGSPLDSTSVSQGLTRWSGGTLQGLADAHLDWAGNIDVTGAMTISLTLNVSGDTTLGGDVSITDDLTIGSTTEITGTTTLHSDLIVDDPGKIVAGNLEIRPSSSGGGAVIMSTSGTLNLIGGPSGVTLAENAKVLLSLNVGENLVVEQRTTLKDHVGMPGLPNAPTGTTLYQVVMGSDGTLYRGAAI